MGNIEGYASANFGAAHLRALELCERTGYPPESLGINFGVSTFQSWRSDLQGALKTAERLSRWGQLRGDIRGRILGELTEGKTRAAYGSLAIARAHLHRALELFESSRDDPAVIWTFGVAISRGIVTYHVLSFLSRVLCLMGYPEQALAHSSAAIEQREEEVVFVAEPMRLAQRLWILSVLGEPRGLVAPAEKMVEHCRHHNLPMFAAMGLIMRGYGIARSGQPETGQSVISDGLAEYTGTGAVRDSCYYRVLLAETHRMVGETDAALSILRAALKESERTGEKCYEAEIRRGIGEAHYQRGDIQAAEQSFTRALAIAHEQGARLLELNSASSYARMLRDQGKPKQSHALLAPIYSWFSEGFDTAPLRRARALLDELEATDNVAVPQMGKKAEQYRAKPLNEVKSSHRVRRATRNGSFNLIGDLPPSGEKADRSRPDQSPPGTDRNLRASAKRTLAVPENRRSDPLAPTKTAQVTPSLPPKLPR